MYDVADDVKALALAPARHIYCRAIIGSRKEGSWENDRNYYDTDHIISAKIDIGASSGGLTIGAAYSAKLTLRLMGNADIRQTDRIIMRVGFYKPDGTKAERIGLGWFYVDKISKKDNITTVTAYDKMLRGAKNYNPSALTFPCRLSELLADVCGKMNIVMRDDVAIPYDALLNEPPIKGEDNEGKPLYYTRREILGYIGSMMGGNWFLDAGGHLAFTQFKPVSGSFVAENSISAEISPDAYTVSGVTWNINGVSYSRFDEDTTGMLEFKNPLSADAKEPVMGAVEKRLLGLTYHNAVIERQGCGWYELGDIVTAERKDKSNAPVLITGISYAIENGGFREKIYSSALTDSQSNYTTGDVTGQTVPQSVAQQSSSSSSGAALTEYEYLTDLSVKYNGITYTAEKDAETGLISRISDSNGNAFKPKINSGITDTAFHNAVFMAVAMHSGFGSPTIMPVRTGLVGYFDYKWQCTPALWTNRIGGDNILITGRAVVDSECLKMPNLTRGIFSGMPYQGNGDFVLYAVMKTEYDSTVNQHDCIIGSSYADAAGRWRTLSTDGYSTDYHFRCWFSDTFGGGIGGELSSGGAVTSYENYSVIALVQTSGNLRLYIDGIPSLDNPAVNARYGDYWGLNCLADNMGGVRSYSNVATFFKMFAIGRVPHTAAQIAENSAWLKKYFGGNLK